MGAEIGAGGAGGADGGAGRATPLGLLLLFTFLSSLGTGVVTNGISFLTKQAYGYRAMDNYALAAALGITYIAGAFFTGRVTGFVRGRTGWTMRTLLVGIIAMMGCLCFVPYLAVAAGVRGSWPVWVLVALYSPLSGMLWPIVESYQAGGRTQDDLRRVIGLFNVVWCSSIVVAMWTMGPFVERSPLAVIMSLGGLHLATIVLILRFGREPASHEESLHPHPEVYERLLAALRVLLPASYVVASALGPYLPDAMERLGVAAAWASPLAATWQVSRLATFFTLGRWQGWHGTWTLPIAGAVLMLAGFGAAVLSPRLGDAGGVGSLVVMLAGLSVFGVGMASIYTAALYYAMEVGQAGSGEADVSSGGTHEALIGVGYTVGPLCGLVPTAMVERGAMAAGWLEPTILAGVGMLGVAGVVAAVSRARKGGRAGNQREREDRGRS